MKKSFCSCNVILFLLTTWFIFPAFSQTNFWEPTNGPYGGSISSLAMNTIGYAFAGTATYGVYRTGNVGAGWEHLNTGLAYEPWVYSLTVLSNDYIYVGTNFGIIRSTNNGTSWVQVNNGIDPGTSSNYVRAFASTGQGEVYVGTDGNGVYRSTDYGAYWTVTTYATGPIRSLTANQSGYVFAATLADGIQRTTDNGGTWIPVNNGVPPYVYCLAVSPQGTLFAAAAHEVYLSTNNGDSWVLTDTVCNDQFLRTLALNSDGHLFAGTSRGELYRSTDMGSHWAQVFAGQTFVPVGALAIDSATGIVFAGTQGDGVFCSTDNGTIWTMENNGLRNTDPQSLVADSTGSVYASIANCVAKTTDNGMTWTRSHEGLPRRSFSFNDLAITASGYLLGGLWGGVYLSTDAGVSWMCKNFGLTDTFVLSLAVSPQGHALAGTYDLGVFRSTDNGDHWTLTGLTCVDALGIRSDGMVFAATRDSGVFRSTDDGSTWLSANVGLPTASVFALGFTSHGYVLAGTLGGGIFRSTNAGLSWSVVLSGTYLGGHGFVLGAAGEVYAATNQGVFRSTNDGAAWSTLNTGLSSLFVWSLVMNRDGYIFAGLGSDGVFRSRQPVTSVVHESIVMPQEFELFQNYPNPFNPSTAINYQLPGQAHVTLKVFDVLGREVATLVNAVESPGYKSVRFDGGTLSSGMYFYKLEAGGYVDVKTLLILK